MQVSLEHTKSSDIALELVRARRASGSPAMDMVLTFIVVCDEETVSDALKTAAILSKEHPARVLGVILGNGDGQPDLQAKIRVGSETSGESILLRMSGPLVEHAESVVLPLLLPDSPVVVWWADHAPTHPGADALGVLANRRLTDSEVASQPVRQLKSAAKNYTDGDTDLAWTRTTTWRALLAAALDQVQATVVGGSISVAAGNPAAELLHAWLEYRLKVPIVVKRVDSDRIAQVTLQTKAGDVSITRDSAESATFAVPGASPNTVPLPTRTQAELLAEDLRRLDADQIYEATIRQLVKTS